MALEFTGNSLALSSQGMASVAGQLSLGLAEIAAVFSVETHGAGFLSDRRPKILFERHIFSRLTGGMYDNSDPSVSAPTPGGYGPGGANQYMRLGEAIALDRQAALQSASWGLGQVMGENYQAAGFADVETMVAAMVDSEDAQLAAMGTLIEQNNLAKSLACHDWQSFARGYNGPNYAINRYDVELNGYYQKYLVSATPDFQIRAAQIYLQFRGFDPHGVDGILGSATSDAIGRFQTSVGIPVTGQLDEQTISALVPTQATALTT
jgi:N-acetylmuramidase/Putative peptidoglycan binding domain